MYTIRTILVLPFFCFQVLLATGENPANPKKAIQWQPLELTFEASEIHSWKDFPMQATFTNGAQSITLDAFWNGDKNWVVRFAAPSPGKWTWETTSKDKGLDDQKGKITITAPTQDQIEQNINLRGHLKISENGHYFEYGDGTPVLLINDTKWGFNAPKPQVDDGGWQHYVDTRKAQEFNSICLRIWSNDDPNDGGHAFHDNKGRPGNGNFKDMNAEYFKYSDRRAEAMWKSGFILAAFPDWFGKIDISVENAKLISRYMLARWNAYNII